MQTFQRDGVWKSLDQIQKEKPVVEVAEPKVEGLPSNVYVCGECQRECKSKLGLISHLRSHKS